MKTNAFRVKRWISLGLLMLMVLSFAAPAFALPTSWYKSVHVTHNPNKMIYEIGESFDPTGLKIEGDVYDSNGHYSFSSNISLGTLTYSPASFSKAGKQKVKLGVYLPGKSGSYEYLYTSVTVTVNESGDSPSEYYTDIFVAAQPKKTIYKIGESFKTSGLSISGHVYREEDGKKHTIPKLSQKNMKISPTKFTKSGKQNVKLSLYLLGKNGEHKWFHTTVEVLVEKGDVKITKHPYGETVQEGGSCGFISRADNDDSRHWFLSKNGTVVDANDASAYFPGLTVSGVTSEHLKLHHIPASMNGWSAYCVFYGNGGSVTSNKAGIVVLSKDATAEPATEAPVEVTPKAIETTPQPPEDPEDPEDPDFPDEPDDPDFPDEPEVTEAPAAPKATRTPKPTKTPKPTPEPDYAEGIHCTINGQSKVPVVGQTLLECEAEEIEGFVFDHWEVNGEPEYSLGTTASFIASEACVIQAYYHEQKVLRTVNCFFQLLTKTNNASGTKYTEFDFEDAYYSPVTNSYCPAGSLSCYVTAVIPRKAEIDYWLINGVKYQFPENLVNKFRIVGLNEATTIEPVFKGVSPTNQYARPIAARELEKQIPMVMRCINCWGQFMNASGKPAGQEYLEFNFEKTYNNPVTRKKLPGGKLDIFISSRLPRGCIVESWLINDVKYQFPGNAVVKFRVMGLDEGTTYEIRFQGVSTGGSPTPGTYTIPGPTPPTNGVAWRWNNN